jgi:flagellin-specific chaperone FliS
MQAHSAYRKQQHVVPARIDHILALYDRGVERAESAAAALAAGDESAAGTAAAQLQMIVAAFTSELSADDPLSVNLLRLYEFVAHSASELTIESMQAAAKVLGTLREGFQAIRDEALRLEREGHLPPLDQTRMVLATARISLPLAA